MPRRPENPGACIHSKVTGDGWNEPRETYCDLDLEDCENCEERVLHGDLYEAAMEAKFEQEREE